MAQVQKVYLEAKLVEILLNSGELKILTPIDAVETLIAEGEDPEEILVQLSPLYPSQLKQLNLPQK
ncbi:MAG: hypothetical protein QXT45_07795 [Candidatus Bilamarchaeaceae archaeon]